MFKFIDLMFHDPILLITTLVMLAAVVILAWAVKEFSGYGKRKLASDPRHAASASSGDGTAPVSQESESYIILEARLREMNNQLSDISRRIAGLEKTLSQRKTADQTAALQPGSAELEKFIQRIESRLELLSSDRSQINGDVIGKIEAKIEGIHKLLIVLTDGGRSEAT